MKPVSTYLPHPETMDKIKAISAEMADSFKELFSVIKDEYHGDTYHDNAKTEQKNINMVELFDNAAQKLEREFQSFVNHARQDETKTVDPLILKANKEGGGTPTHEDLEAWRKVFDGKDVSVFTNENRGPLTYFDPIMNDYITIGGATFTSPLTQTATTAAIWDGYSATFTGQTGILGGLIDSFIGPDGYADFKLYTMPIAPLGFITSDSTFFPIEQMQPLSTMKSTQVSTQSIQEMEDKKFADAISNAETSSIWTDALAMFEDIREHAKNNGRAIIPADNPAKLRLGWCCSNTGKCWEIRIVDMRKAIEQMPSQQGDLFRRALQTQDSKAALIEILNNKDSLPIDSISKENETKSSLLDAFAKRAGVLKQMSQTEELKVKRDKARENLAKEKTDLASMRADGPSSIDNYPSSIDNYWDSEDNAFNNRKNQDDMMEPLKRIIEELTNMAKEVDAVKDAVRDGVIDDKVKTAEDSIEDDIQLTDVLSTPKGRSDLAMSMTRPIRDTLDYQGIAKLITPVERRPQGAAVIYDGDIDVSAIVSEADDLASQEDDATLQSKNTLEDPVSEGISPFWLGVAALFGSIISSVATPASNASAQKMPEARVLPPQATQDDECVIEKTKEERLEGE